MAIRAHFRFDLQNKLEALQANLLVVVVQRQYGNIVHQQSKLESLTMEI